MGLPTPYSLPLTAFMQLYVLDLGLTPYDVAWALQKRAAAARISGALDQDLLILVQHPPVVTLGRSTKPGNLLVSPEYLASRGIELRDVERGGDVTIHEPGQLVAYPIIDLKRHKQDLHWYLRQIEEAVIVALTSFGLECGRVAGRTGVWRERDTGNQVKLASIGVHAKEWVTSHGVALNVCNDLATFNHVVPCGLGDVQMSTVSRECAEASLPAPEFAAVEWALVDAFSHLFSLRAEPVPAALTASWGEPLG